MWKGDIEAEDGWEVTVYLYIGLTSPDVASKAKTYPSMIFRTLYINKGFYEVNWVAQKLC